MEQDDAEDETRSVNGEVENTRVFSTATGWTVLEEYIYIDDGVSDSVDRAASDTAAHEPLRGLVLEAYASYEVKLARTA